MGGVESKKTGFQWPPRKPVEIVASAEPHPPLSADRSRDVQTARSPVPAPPARSWLSHIEHTWLDTIAPPLHERMQVEDWSPDAASRYCPRCAASVGRHDLTDGRGSAYISEQLGRCTGRHEVSDGRCPECKNARLPWERIVRLGEYEHPLRHWVHEVKFTRWRRLGRDLGRLLGDAVAAQLAAARAANPDAIPAAPALVVPVPTTLRRLMLRGIDHSRVLALGVADRIGGRVVQPLVREHRPSQLHVAPSRRAANIVGAFRPKAAWRRADLSGRLVIVVDDVTTTGATLRAACRSAGLCGSGTERPRLWAAVLAKTPAGESLHTVT